MDIVIGVLSLILAVVCGVVVYFISVSSMKEKTYDEVKAEQKKKTEEYLAPGRSAKDKAKDKKVKKAVKKLKENQKSTHSAAPEILKESDSDENHVELVQPPVQKTVKEQVHEIEENILESNLHVKKQPGNQIGLPTSKNNSSNTVDQPSKASKPQQTSTKPQQKPADKPAKLLKNNQQNEPPLLPKTDQKPKIQSNNIQENQVKLKVLEKAVEAVINPPEKIADSKPNVVTKEITKTSLKPLNSSGSNGVVQPPAKISRKKRNEISTLHQINGEKETVDAAVLTALVRKSEMTRTEIQALIECLLNKQLSVTVDATEWSEGRQDPVVRLKKQLAEKERVLTEEQEAAVALQSKLRDLRNELNAARATARHHEEALNAQQADIGARLQHAADEKQSLVQQIQTLQRKLLQSQQEQEQQLQHELLAQRQQLEIHITRLTEQHQEEARVELERLMGKLQYETGRLQTEINSLSEQLSAKHAEADQLANVTQALQTENSRLKAQISSACVEAQQLRDENESLSAQVAQGMERPAAEGRENGDGLCAADVPHKLSDADVLIEKLRQDLDTNEKELSRCKSELLQRETLIADLKRDLDKAHLNAENVHKEYKYTIQEKDSAIKALRDEKESGHKLVSSLREDVSKREAEIARLSRDSIPRSQLESQESLVEALKCELNTHKTRIADQQMMIEALRVETERRKMDNDGDDLRRKLVTRDSEIFERDAKINALTTQVSAYKADAARLEGALNSSKEAADQFSRELKLLTEKHSSVCSELQLLKNGKSVMIEAMRAETELRKTDIDGEDLRRKLIARDSEIFVRDAKINALTTQVSAYKAEATRLQGAFNSSKEAADQFSRELKLLSENHSSVCSELELLKNEKSGEESAAELLEQNGQLQSLVAHYKAIIGDTESMLNQLQSHVEREETRWRQQMHTLEERLRERDATSVAAEMGTTDSP